MSTGADELIGLSLRIRKLRAMSPAEVAHRLRYKATIARERRDHRRGTLTPADRLSRALTPELAGAAWKEQLLMSRAASASRLAPSAYQRDAMRLLFATRYQAERDDMRARAAETRAHRFSFFGETFEFGDEIPWQHDPVTGRAWPSVYHADVRVHVGDVGCGDVKHVWELSRMQYLVDLARASFIDDDRESLASLRRLVRSWIAGNPYATGVHWSCALEPAFRTFSWLWAYALTWTELDETFHLEWIEGFLDAGRFLERHLEHYTSPYNHLLGEAAALYMIGATFPEFQRASRWQSVARRILEDRLAEQFYADGGTSEQSTFYHHASVGDYLLAALTARQIGEDFSPAVWRAIERGIDFSTALMLPDGRTPEIGGADDGKPIRMEHLPLWDFRGYQALGAVLFSRGDLKTLAGRFHEDALWLLGPAGIEAFDALPSSPPGATSFALRDSGYYVMRSDWSSTADYLCFDCGPQALGMRPDGIPNSMHGHADCLSVIVSLRGRRVLVDSGFFAYNVGGVWETHFRETAAHNTARIDGKDQARHLGKMAWSHSYRALPEGWHEAASDIWAVGSHDGYDRSPDGVTHRRAAWLRQPGYVVICDEFIGHGAHDIEVNFQFAPGAAALDDDRAVVHLGDIASLHWTGNAAWTAELANGGSAPDQGWIALSLGVKQAAPRVSLRQRTTGTRSWLLTVLVPGGADGPAFDVSRHPSGALVVTGPDFEDHVTPATVATARRDDEALVAVTRVGGDVSTATVAVLAHGGRTGPVTTRPRATT